MKSVKITYWVTTLIIFLFDSALPAFTSNTQLAIDGIRHLGFPDYFRHELTVFKVIGGILLIVPAIPARFKEWAYVGFGISFISAFVANAAVTGFNGLAFFPLIALAILVVSYICYHKLNNYGRAHNTNGITGRPANAA